MTPAEITTVLVAHRQWLRGEAGGQRAVLSGADLSDADLRGAVLRGAVLRGAVLRGAVLRGAVLSGADLRDAVLSDAVLSDAVLSGAVLRGADLRGADLRDAVLRGAKGVLAAWQGGAYGPRRRQITVFHRDDRIEVHAGCIAGDAATVVERLTRERLRVWIDELGDQAAHEELADAVALIDLGVATVTRHAGRQTTAAES